MRTFHPLLDPRRKNPNPLYKNPQIPHFRTITQFEPLQNLNPAPENPRNQSMDPRMLGLSDPTLLSAVSHLIGGGHHDDDKKAAALNPPMRSYVLDTRAMAATPADVKDLVGAYEFVIDMPGVRSGDIKVQVEDGSVLIITGERRREEEEKGAKYLRMERWMGKLMRMFSLPDNANTDAITAVCKDGVLTVTVKKVPLPEPKKPKTIEVQVA